jgi:hypothetical protein
LSIHVTNTRVVLGARVAHTDCQTSHLEEIKLLVVVHVVVRVVHEKVVEGEVLDHKQNEQCHRRQPSFVPYHQQRLNTTPYAHHVSICWRGQRQACDDRNNDACNCNLRTRSNIPMSSVMIRATVSNLVSVTNMSTRRRRPDSRNTSAT